MLAAEQGHTGTVTALLENDEDIEVNAKDPIGVTALMWAAEHGDTEMATALLAVPGIDVNAADNKGCTALMWAAGNGHTDTVVALAGVPGVNPYLVTSADVEVGLGQARVTIPSGSSAMVFAKLTQHGAAAEALKPLFSKSVKSAATAAFGH